MSHYIKILIWQKSISLVTKIHKSTNSFPKEETFGLTSQIRRSSLSIPSNIAEGSERDSNKDFVRFLYISLGSLFEMQTQLEIAKDIAYLNENEFNNLYEDSREVESMLVSFIKNLKNKS
ncbi:four helix bundle protein [Flavobacterium sp. MC2016-06]|uniref:four helix bundle protein n=1 Tax=Flavobacterium sp. MC2016-06 TaxID=2676308 RepID=UPI0012BAE856|nr:four helix bundle protein [Flavobacterium sp. MC2016-06]MBU3861313.1 four helix bundle protein [Flavobacterium sp. MC2016-06]